MQAIRTFLHSTSLLVRNQTCLKKGNQRNKQLVNKSCQQSVKSPIDHSLPVITRTLSKFRCLWSIICRCYQESSSLSSVFLSIYRIWMKYAVDIQWCQIRYAGVFQTIKMAHWQGLNYHYSIMKSVLAICILSKLNPVHVTLWQNRKTNLFSTLHWLKCSWH